MNPELKAAIVAMVERMGMLKYFPTDPGARKAIMSLIAGMARTPEQVRHFEGKLLNRWSEWEGPGRLREEYCQLYAPADGRESGQYEGEMEYVTRGDEEEPWMLTAAHAPAQLQAPPEPEDYVDDPMEEQDRRFRVAIRRAPLLAKTREAREFEESRNEEEREGLLEALEKASRFAERATTQLRPTNPFPRPQPPQGSAPKGAT